MSTKENDVFYEHQEEIKNEKKRKHEKKETKSKEKKEHIAHKMKVK